MIAFILGLLDLLGGLIILSSPGIILPILLKPIGIILIIKGCWSMISDIKFLLKTG